MTQPHTTNVTRVNREQERAWERAFGELPAGFRVLQKCDEITCMNPEHLIIKASHSKRIAKLQPLTKNFAKRSRLMGKSVKWIADRLGTTTFVVEELLNE